MAYPKRDACVKGHPFTPDNFWVDKWGARVCRQCKRDRHKAWRQANPDYDRERKDRWESANPERVRATNQKAGRKWRAANREAERTRWHRRRSRLLDQWLEDVDRLVVYDRDGGSCHICGAFVPEDTFTLDHIVPLARGGPHAMNNVAVAHLSCNASKGARV